MQHRWKESREQSPLSTLARRHVDEATGGGLGNSLNDLTSVNPDSLAGIGQIDGCSPVRRAL